MKNGLFKDSSTEWIAASLLKCKEWLIRGQKGECEKFLSTLPSDSAVQAAATESQVVDSSTDDEISESEKHTKDEKGKTRRSARRRMETDEDGWTTVTRR